jgi:hypothetical protein
MAVYRNSEQLDTVLKSLFESIGDDPSSAQSVTKANLIIRLTLKAPDAEVTINGRKNPVTVSYDSSKLRPDLQVEMTADAFHGIMLKELPLGKALSSGQMRVKGPVHKSFVLQDIFHRGQELYPQVAREAGLI